MPTLWNARDRDRLLGRLDRLSPDARARWGKFTPARMLAHVNDTLRMAAGALAATPKRTPLRFPVVKQLVIYAAPWPKGVPTAPELLARGDAVDFEKERAAFPDALRLFADRPADAAMPAHPAFGKLSRRAWGFLQYRHTDHHFRQFGG